jgi:hypothetical protein
MSTSLAKHMTITQAAEKYGVSRQRMHQLIDTYGAETIWIGSVKLISTSELRKIPKKRPNGKNFRQSAKHPIDVEQ